MKYVNYARYFIVFMLLCILIFNTVACSNSTDPDALPPSELKVMYWDEQGFYAEYGDLLSAKYPNITFQVLPVNNLFGEEFAKYVKKEKPDLIYFSSEQDLGRLAEDGELLDLESYIKKDHYDIDALNPNVLSTIRREGNGKLYGLTPTFYSQALFYNRALFDKYGVPYPTDRMTWEDILSLGARFKSPSDGKDQVYGLDISNSNPGYFLTSQLGGTEGLEYIDLDTKKITVDTEAWNKVWNLGIEAYNNGAISSPLKPDNTIPEYDAPTKDRFINGQAAMTIQSYYIIHEIERAQRNAKKPIKVDWGLVTEPVSSKDPNTTTNFFISGIFAIHANSANKEAAWEVMKYINGDEWARIRSRSGRGLLTRTEYNLDKNGQSLAPFFELQPRERTMDYTKYPKNFDIFTLADKEIQLVLSGQKSVDQGLKDLQQAAQSAVDLSVSVQKQEAK